MYVVLASITDPLVQFATDVIDTLGLPGIFVLMVAESACIPIPSEATMLFAGFNVADGQWTMAAVTTVGVAGNVVGSWIAYAVGYFGRVDVLERHGAKLHVKRVAPGDRRPLVRALRSTRPSSSRRLLPIVRTFISLPAGVARMPFWRFTALTVLGCLPWVWLLAFVGMQAGDNWDQWKDNLHYVDYAVVAAIVLGLAWLLVRRSRRTDATA